MSDDKKDQERIQFLVTEIKEAKEAYYNNKGLIKYTDEEYDALEEELHTLDKENPLLQCVGIAPNSIWPKKKHRIPMGSLNKVKGTDGIKDWWRKLI